MPKGYWIGRVDVIDPDGYNEYTLAAAIAFRKYGARFIVRGGKFEVAQGGSRGRNVVIEFPSYQAALDCWHSPDYRGASPLLMQATQADIIIIEGYDGPQPL
jgi:uncharacterized protein (DUF1330 family)